MPALKYSTPHKRARAAMLAQLPDGSPCVRCGHPMYPGSDRLALDHTDDGAAYLGFSHDSPCPLCGERCNSAAGGRNAATRAGRKLRGRRCVICGKPYRAIGGTDGAKQVTCASRACITEIRRLRREHQDDPEPPPVTGRAW